MDANPKRDPGKLQITKTELAPKCESSSSLLKINSKAVVKYEESKTPALFNQLQYKTDLNMPPANWLREAHKWKGMGLQSDMDDFTRYVLQNYPTYMLNLSTM